jgi:hypothetical protein
LVMFPSGGAEHSASADAIQAPNLSRVVEVSLFKKEHSQTQQVPLIPKGNGKVPAEPLR